MPASGRGGRLTKGDVVNYLKAGGPSGPRAEERVKMTRLRSRIAERMKEAQNTAAVLTTFQEVDLKIRARPARPLQGGIRTGAWRKTRPDVVFREGRL